MYDIVTVGSATVDLFADTDSELVQIETRHSCERLIAYPLGGKILIRELVSLIGGGGTNTAVAFARQGLRTAFLGKIGTDAQGDQVLELLDQEGVDFVGVRDGQTGLSVILDSIRQDRTILAFKGANDQLHYDEVRLPECRWLYCSSMLGESLDTLQRLIRESGVRVAFNPSSYLATQGLQALRPILEHTQVLILNREEACQLLAIPEHERLPLPVLSARLQQALPQATVAVTDGADGVAATDGERMVLAQPRADLVIVETTGAGDAFASGFVGQLCRDASLEQAVRAGMLSAESVLVAKGAKNHLLRAAELAEGLAHDRRPLEVRPLTDGQGLSAGDDQEQAEHP